MSCYPDGVTVLKDCGDGAALGVEAGRERPHHPGLLAEPTLFHKGIRSGSEALRHSSSSHRMTTASAETVRPTEKKHRPQNDDFSTNPEKA